MTRSLAGKRVINTRSGRQAEALDRLLVSEGAVPVSFPCIAIESAPEPEQFDAAMDEACDGSFQWVVFTSVNTVRALEARRDATGRRWRLPASCRSAAVGRVTAAAVERTLGRPVDFVPASEHAAALSAELPVQNGTRVLIPGSSLANPKLAETLRGRGAEVTVVTAYRTVPTAPSTDLGFLCGSADAITFASPSAVEGFAGAMVDSSVAPRSLERLVIACIGPTTLAAAGEWGFPNPVMAHEPSGAGIIKALKTAFQSHDQQEAIQRR